MHFLDLTLRTLAENLALDEALLQAADQRDHDGLERFPEVLRIWQINETAAIVGRSSRVADEVDVELAQQMSVPIMRRCSGGGTVVVGDGCLLYSLLIDLSARPALRMLDEVHRYVMIGLKRAIEPLVPGIVMDGTCDLIIDNRKFSGNALKVGRNWTLYHGTILLDMQLNLIERLLQHPPREPQYRQRRSHTDFVTNINVDSEKMTQALRQGWKADSKFDATSLLSLVEELVAQRYGQQSWNFQR
jgi:lipoate---protein ligase